MVAEALLGGVAEAVVGFLLEQGSGSLKARLGLARDPITVAFDTALHRAVADTFVAHQDYDGTLFHATFLKYEGAPLLATTLTPDDTVTGADLAAAWAIACAERVMPYFVEAFPDDPRPRAALETLQTWIDTGVFLMKVIRKASLDAHAAARDVGEDNAARSAARAAGQAVATAHVRTHAPGAALYALQAIHRATDAEEVAAALAREREWQYGRLEEMVERLA